MEAKNVGKWAVNRNGKVIIRDKASNKGCKDHEDPADEGKDQEEPIDEGL